MAFTAVTGGLTEVGFWRRLNAAAENALGTSAQNGGVGGIHGCSNKIFGETG